MRVFQNAVIIDGTGAEPFIADVAVRDGRIVRLGDGIVGDDYVDLSGRFVTPGFIDCHVHLMVESFDLMGIIDAPFSLAFYVAASNLQRTLGAGVTFIRDAGGADLGVKRAQELGLVTGPGMQISINLISTTGGHADHWGSCGYATPDLVEHPGRPDGVCDGEVEVLRTTRKMIRAGADFIKVCATGGVLSPRDHPSDAQFLPHELRSIVETAAQSGRPVAAHAQGAAGVKNALRAGVATIEHGSMIDDESIELLVDSGAVLVPTMTALHYLSSNTEGRRRDEIAKVEALVAHQKASISRAIAAGVRIALGSDAGVGPHGENLSELIHLMDCGMSALEAIRAGTLVGAEVLGLANERGTIAESKVADLVVLDEDPLTDMSALASGRAIREVWQDGVRKVVR